MGDPVATQLAIDLPTWPDRPLRSAWAVQVNEVHVHHYASRDTATWWAGCFRLLPAQRTRICVTDSVGPGEVLHVHCEDQEHAEWLRSHLADRGIAKAALKVLRRLDCRPSVEPEEDRHGG